ncbi:hypothetical protein [Microbacterium sp. VKM Ac-2923]|uniref:hypothetical protein n=1 Tax=Microbacterium sp. VKM Ac-2923 TaxID=2929476 RepID=UPI001FB55791|nr:hypothetical protein [Microbacterium sp. VKM Ac-2923]MCJ1709213.1 hypothetical protein [Microbacterium sp. VKM Ac-2923]
MTLETIRRSAKALAPKLIAFLATGLTASALIGALQWAGAILGWDLTISPTLATLIVGGLSSVAAYVQRDKLLDLPPAQLASKVAVFILTSVSAVTIVAVATEFGVNLESATPVIGASLTLIGAILGYAKADLVIAPEMIDLNPADFTHEQWQDMYAARSQR